MKLSIVTVNTNEWHVLETALRSVFEQTSGLPFEVIVVDNASRDGSCEKLAAHFPQVRVVRNPHNMGFAGSNNRGFEVATGEYVLLLNPDTEVRDGAISKCVAFLDEHPSVGGLGCKLLFPDGRLQRTVHSFPGVWRAFCQATLLYLIPVKGWIWGERFADFRYDVARPVDWVLGAYLMVRRSVMDRIGFLDEQFYMYSEEVDYCLRIWREGYEVWFLPEATVLHFWTGFSAPNRRSMVWTFGSELLYYQKHFRPPARWLLVGLKYFGILLRVGAYAIAGLVTGRPVWSEKASHAAFALRVLPRSPWKYRPGHVGPVDPWPRYEA